MSEEKEVKKERWYSRLFGGRKAMMVTAFLGLPLWVVLIWSYIIRDWIFAKFILPILITAICIYLGINITQKIKLNGKGNNAEK